MTKRHTLILEKVIQNYMEPKINSVLSQQSNILSQHSLILNSRRAREREIERNKKWKKARMRTSGKKKNEIRTNCTLRISIKLLMESERSNF